MITHTKKKLAVLGVTGFCLLVQYSKSQNRPSWVAPPEAVAKVNPYKDDNTPIKDLKALYINSCSPCHGEKGKGDGIAAIACNPKPADHTSDFVQMESDGSLFWKISEGKGSMTPFKNVLTEKQRWQLVNYIRTLKAKK